MISIQTWNKLKAPSPGFELRNGKPYVTVYEANVGLRRKEEVLEYKHMNEMLDIQISNSTLFVASIHQFHFLHVV